jgi:hypothetical protein
LVGVELVGGLDAAREHPPATNRRPKVHPRLQKVRFFIFYHGRIRIIASSVIENRLCRAGDYSREGT